MIAGTVRFDEALRKGAMEDDSPETARKERWGQNSMVGQLGHRDQDEMLKDADTDFPEPDAAGEHSGR